MTLGYQNPFITFGTNNCHPQPSECFYGAPIKKAFVIKL